MLVEPPPPRITALLDDLGIDPEQVTVLRKSALKVNDTLPTIWIVGTVDQILLCCTHRTRGLWHRLARAEINEARSEATATGRFLLRLILNADQDDIVIPFPAGLSMTEAKLIAATLPTASKRT
ncbi:MAG: hypothetical protein NTY35_16735 [Planctomycetota bacterium]|nr:hypothetical protein [Planctomycetota bacterium]